MLALFWNTFSCISIYQMLPLILSGIKNTYHFFKGDSMMEIAKVFHYNNSQAVKLPDKYRLTCDEVTVQKVGSSLILTPKDKIRDNLLSDEVEQNSR